MSVIAEINFGIVAEITDFLVTGTYESLGELHLAIAEGWPHASPTEVETALEVASAELGRAISGSHLRHGGAQ